ncbi:hypothetical protein XBKB1_690002 [Xenorhabdus bovienii str. kraussei Becker Underwood]|uniref:Uncharacterized protein n=1 Tax=Xenorhabdus bovienii str. kraussei Becker Underwood TaxID=1398204 RepID=A0A077Q0C7_XENBV|nr:hypothetical protein XBKB1_690002 [Xenorhabdus bovienii str. kraussei Becker Underwood]
MNELIGVVWEFVQVGKKSAKGCCLHEKPARGGLVNFLFSYSLSGRSAILKPTY